MLRIARTNELDNTLIIVHELRPYPSSLAASLFPCCSTKQLTTHHRLPTRWILVMRKVTVYQAFLTSAARTASADGLLDAST